MKQRSLLPNWLYFKGATAYELQIGRVYVRLVHLTGGDWNSWKIWERLSIRRTTPEGGVK